jgi:hypothetical protein
LTLVDLGKSPLCESFLSGDRLESMEPFFPLHARICSSCWLVQLPSFVRPEEIFGEYAYFSAYSDSWVEHARRYVDTISDRLGLSSESFVVEVASNDGYLLQHLVTKGIPVLGIDPAANVARAAEERGVPTLVEFFGAELAARIVAQGRHAALIVANNVLAQVPDLNDFVRGIAILLARNGTATFEFPHLVRLLDGVQYDTIYHEHFSYFSLSTVAKIFGEHGLTVVDVEELSTHGGSLRVYARHAAETGARARAVADLLAREAHDGIQSAARYERFAHDVQASKRALLQLLIELRHAGKRIVGYGAPGKGNTLLNYCGIRTDFVEYTVDRNAYKHGRFTPGTQIPIYPPEHIADTRPDIIVVLPWNLADEISEQLAYSAEWGARLLIPIPLARLIVPGTTLAG